MKKRILEVDDDPELRQLLDEYLSSWGYGVLLASDGVQMCEQLPRQQVALVSLDLILPGEDGLSLCCNLRARSELRILMLTTSSDEVNRILGLEMGADEDGSHATPARTLHFAGWTLDLNEHHLIHAGSDGVSLSSGEFRLLKALPDHPGRVLSHNQLLEVFSNREAAPFDRTINVMISRLRLLADDGEEPLIKIERNEGYMFNVPVERRT